jgi:hypothetical protein
MRRPHVTPSFVLSAFALFFALGGSAFALRDAAPKPAPKCAVGTARAIVYVTGETNKGIANLPDNWSSAGSLFGYRWSCSGGIEVRKAVESGGGFDIRFPGNPGRYPVATAVFPKALGISIAPLADGSFHITEGGNIDGGDSFPPRSDGNVVIVLF